MHVCNCHFLNNHLISAETQDWCENNAQAIEYLSLRDKSGLLQSRDSHRVAKTWSLHDPTTYFSLDIPKPNVWIRTTPTRKNLSKIMCWHIMIMGVTKCIFRLIFTKNLKPLWEDEDTQNTTRAFLLSPTKMIASF